MFLYNSTSRPLDFEMWTSLYLCLMVRFAFASTNLLTRATTVSSYASSSDSALLLSKFDLPMTGPGNVPPGAATWTFTVDDTSVRQSILGFGAAVTDSTTASFGALSDATLQELLQILLTQDGPNGALGAGFSLMRHTIGASDLSGYPAYTYDDNKNTPDPGLENFTLTDRGTDMVGLLHRMKSINPAMKIIGTPWSPPGWMKNNKALVDGDSNKNTLNHNYSTQYANYFVRYLKQYATQGVPVDFLTIQNEPLNNKAQFPTMKILADEAGQLIQNYVGPAVKQYNSSLQIWGWDLNTNNLEYPATVVADAPNYVPAIAWHCYADPLDWSNMSSFHDAHPNVAQYMTECITTNSTHWYWPSNFTMNPLRNWGGASLAWVLGTDTSDGPNLNNSESCKDCQGIVVVDTDKKSYFLTRNFYMMAQYSRFIPRGANVLDVQGGQLFANGSAIQSTATLNPDGKTKTIVIENRFPNDVYVTMNFVSKATSWTGRVYKQSVVTWVLPK